MFIELLLSANTGPSALCLLHHIIFTKTPKRGPSSIPFSDEETVSKVTQPLSGKTGI